MSNDETRPENETVVSVPASEPLSGLVGTRRSALRYKATMMDDMLAIVFFFCCLGVFKSVLPQSRTANINLIAGLAAYVIYLSYYFIFEACFAATPGKAWFGLTVRQLDGSKCTVWSAFIRTFSRLFELNPLILGYWPAVIVYLRSKRKQRIGDMLAGTVVVEKRVVEAALSAKANAP